MIAAIIVLLLTITALLLKITDLTAKIREQRDLLDKFHTDYQARARK